jgi:hypothetical protein
MTQSGKFIVILADLENGNLRDFRAAVRKLNKLQTLDFVEFACGNGIQRHITINHIRSILATKE